MGLKELVLGAAVTLAAAQPVLAGVDCANSCQFPQLMTCTGGTEDIRPRLKRHGEDGRKVDTYFIKVGNSDAERYVEHLTYIPEGKVVAASRFERLGRTGTGSRTTLYLDFAPYGSVDEVYIIEQNVAKGLKFILDDVPEMIVEGRRKGDLLGHMKSVLGEYRDDSTMRTHQYLYRNMIAAAQARVCTH